MNKKKVLRFVVLFLGPVILFSFVSYKFVNLSRAGLVIAVTPEIVNVEISHIYSDVLRDEMNKYINQCLAKSQNCAFDAKNFCKKIKNHFKIVRGVKWDFSSPEKAQLFVVGVEPQFLLNDKFVLGNKKRLFPCSLFDNYPIGSLKKITMAAKHCNEKIGETVYNFLHKIPPEYFDKYTVAYEDANKIMLESLHLKNRVVVFVDEQSFFANDLLKKLSLVEDDFVVSRHTLFGRRLSMRKKQLVCDLRFKNGVCVKAEKLV